MSVPQRSRQQQLDALRRANEIRVFRADLKEKIGNARRDADEVLVSGDERLATMYVEELLRAVPGLGKVRIRQWFFRHQISPSKTIGGLSSRQRGALLVLLREHRSASNVYAKRKAGESVYRRKRQAA
jgi:hypothetical protein